MPKRPKNFHKKPKKEFHKIIERILRQKNPAKEAAIAYWRHKHKEAIKELLGEGERFKLDERLESYRKIDKGLEPLYKAVRRRDSREILRQKNEIEAWVERLKQGLLTVSPEARRIMMECTIVNLYNLAIAKTMIALLLSERRREL